MAIPRLAETREGPAPAVLGHRELILGVTGLIAGVRAYQTGETVIAMVAFLRKAGRTEAMPYVHGGWVGALLAGAATWMAATWLVEISGASRELTEGFAALFAAAVLVSVGIWMHGKAQAEEWRRYIATKMQGALSRGSAWFLFGLAFIVVYREVFETILFYAALWTADNGGTIAAGALTAVVVLSGGNVDPTAYARILAE